MTFSDETLMAYVDGELEPAARAELEAALSGDPQLAQRVAAQRALSARMQQAFAPVLEEPVPERLLRAARGASLAARRAPPRWSWPQWGALAASLVLGALLGPLLLRTPNLTTRDGRLLASGTLARALSQQLASGQSREAPVQIGISFHAQDGAYCRSFRLGESAALAGLACRRAGAWQLEVLAAAAPGSTAGYRPAASLPAAVTQAVDATIAGEPLDAAQEALAREHGWER